MPINNEWKNLILTARLMGIKVSASHCWKEKPSDSTIEKNKVRRAVMPAFTGADGRSCMSGLMSKVLLLHWIRHTIWTCWSSTMLLIYNPHKLQNGCPTMGIYCAGLLKDPSHPDWLPRSRWFLWCHWHWFKGWPLNSECVIHLNTEDTHRQRDRVRFRVSDNGN